MNKEINLMEEEPVTAEEPTFLEDDFEALPANSLKADEIVRKPTTYAKDVWRSFRQNKIALVCLVVMSIMVIMVLFGPMLNSYDYRTNDYDALNQWPSAQHWFGTDNLGRDIWTRLWQGGRVSLFIAIVATIIPEVIGWLIGGISGYFGGKIDMIIMRIIDILMGIPSMIFTILLMVVIGAGNVWTLVLAFSITGWLGSARYTRGRILQLKTMEYVMAAKTLGASPMRIILRHLIPNTLNMSVISIAMGIPSVIFAEAFYSYIGLGIAPPAPSWGQMIKTASEVFMQYPYQFMFPCACVAITMLCSNLIGDGLRDAMDPRLRS